jgi:predicted phage terminase large subunit-like protein
MPSVLDPGLIPTREELDRLAQRDAGAAAQRLAISREMARRNFACFLRYWMLAARAPFLWNWHWHYLADVMQAVTERDAALRFLIVNIPPRFAKSTLLSQMWHAWMIGVEDSRRSSLFSITHTATLAARDSRKTLEAVKSVWYQKIFPHVRVGHGKETEMEWETGGGAYRIACGTGGNVTGRGADHLLVDDLLKADEANSDLVREKANEWMGETLRSRLDDQMTGTITVIMQRLHERDATGYLLEQMKIPGADQYHHIKLPMEAVGRTTVQMNGTIYAERADGELLHPAYVDANAARAIKVAQRHNYEGQYQQNPVKMQGGHLDPRRILRLQGSGIEIKSRLGLTPVFYMDFAATEKQTQKNDPDYSTIAVWARDQLGRLIVLDLWRKQTADYAVVARTLIHMHRLWRPRFVKGERGGLLNLFQPVLQQQMTLVGHFLSLEPLPARRHDKMERSMPYQGTLNAGLVCAPQDAPWFEAFEAEQRAFPNGAHDDMCDTAFDAAAEYQSLPRGAAPVVSPTDPDVLLSDEIKARIERAREEQLNPPRPADDW